MNLQGRFLSNILMPEMPDTRKNHGYIKLIAGLNNLVIRLGTAGLNDGSHACPIQHIHGITIGEKAI
jgi:hypothetical protein